MSVCTWKSLTAFFGAVCQLYLRVKKELDKRPSSEYGQPLTRPFFSLWSSAVADDGDGELVLCVHPISSSSWVMRFFLGGRTRNPLFHRQARYLQVPSINVLSRARLNLSLPFSLYFSSFSFGLSLVYPQCIF